MGHRALKNRLRTKRDAGVVLLLTLMVVAVLVVLVGQFSYSGVLDRKVARNHVDNTQTYLDIRSAGAAVSAYLDRLEEPVAGTRELTLTLDETEIRILLTDEQGKFNLNSLATPPPGMGPEAAEAAFQRLWKRADRPTGTLPAGVDEAVVRLVKESEVPLLTLGALFQAGEVTWETLETREDETAPDGEVSGLAAYFTVWTDGRVNPASAPDEVLLAIAGMGEQAGAAQADQLRARLADPQAPAAAHIAAGAQRASRWVTQESAVYSATVSTDREGYRKRARIVLRRGPGGRFRLAMVNEME